jgi:HlyD family secretion protein
VAVAAVGWFVAVPRGTPPSRFDTVALDRGTVTARVTATGTLSALVTVQVGSQVSGRILSLGADFNSPVKKGQVIARIDPQLFRAALEQARANVSAAEGNLARTKAQAEEARRQAARSQELAALELIPTADRDTAVSNATAADAQVMATAGTLAQTKAALVQAEVNLRYTDIVSPIDGMVISRSVDVGQTVAASLQAPTLFTIAENLARMQVDTNVAESDVGKLKAGMIATFGVDAYPGQRFTGTVRQIRNAPQTIQNVVTYDAVIDVENPEGKLKPGMTANVNFVFAERNDVLVLPNSALRYRPPPTALGTAGRAAAAGPVRDGRGPAKRAAGEARDPSARTVWVLDGIAPRAVEVRTGVTDGSVTELVSGELKEGDRLIIGSTAPVASPVPAGPGPGGGGPAMRRPF